MGHALAQLVIPHASEDPANNLVNVFHFESTNDSPTGLNADQIAGALEDFYEEPGLETASLTSFMSAGVIRPTGWTVKVYDADVTPMGPPVHVRQFDVSGLSNNQPLPSECAVVLSFKGANPAPGAPHPPQLRHPGLSEELAAVNVLARRRGRLFLGGLHFGVVDAASGVARPSVALRAAILNSARILAGELEDGTDLLARWRGYSKADNVLWPIVHGWVDDAFDTQRRRGEKATGRMTFNVT